MHIRKNAHLLTPAELVTLRSAFTKTYEISRQNANDERGYPYFAGLHGLPVPVYCQHGTLLFLPWHRAYLYFFELALREVEPTVTLPWWDWTSARSRQTGLPPAYSQSGNNPLRAGPLYVDTQTRNTIRTRLPGRVNFTPTPPRTVRRTGVPSRLPQMQSTQAPDDWNNVETILGASSFADFSTRLEDVHGGIHIWVNGSMGAVPVAGYDPIFWAHHSMIDRLWYLWQIRHADVGPDNALLDEVLVPFNVRVRDMLNIRRLDYEDAAISTRL